MSKKEDENLKNEEELDILDVLLDENNDSPITLYDEEDNPVKFDQVAIIPLEEKLFAILKPIDEMEGVADDEAIVFLIEENKDGDSQLIVETDEARAMRVFDYYYRLLDEIEEDK